MHNLALMTALILVTDPFQAPPIASCGAVRSLTSVAELLRFGMTEPPPDYAILDDVVMDYWESHESQPGVALWTPLCSSRDATHKLR